MSIFIIIFFKCQVFIIPYTNWKQSFASKLEIHFLVIYTEDAEISYIFTISPSPNIVTDSTYEPIFDAAFCTKY